jgi:hypothetical protein
MRLNLMLLWITLSFIVVGIIMLLLQPSIDPDSLVAVVK